MLAVVLTGLAVGTQAADELDSLDEDFLTYLAELEGDEDDWTIVEVAPESAPEQPRAAAKPAATDKPPATDQPSTSATKPPPVSRKPTTPDDGSKP